VLRAAPILDRSATLALVHRLFSASDVVEIGDALLSDAVNPAEDVVYVGCFPGLDVICGWQLVTDRPSTATERILAGAARPTAYLHAMHTVVDWCAFGLWTDGTLGRAVSVSSGAGVVEDIGERLSFEEPYWAGARTDGRDDAGTHPLPFRPVELATAALHAFFGFRLDGGEGIDDVDPEIIPVVGYRVTPPARA